MILVLFLSFEFTALYHVFKYPYGDASELICSVDLQYFLICLKLSNTAHTMPQSVRLDSKRARLHGPNRIIHFKCERDSFSNSREKYLCRKLAGLPPTYRGVYHQFCWYLVCAVRNLLNFAHVRRIKPFLWYMSLKESKAHSFHHMERIHLHQFSPMNDS